MYEPVFRRNERFAVIHPIPTFGDNNSSMDEINRFYDYWAKVPVYVFVQIIELYQ